MSKTTFTEIYKRWYDDTFDVNTNRSTKKNYEAAYKHCGALYDMKMADIHHLQVVLNDCPNGYQSVKRIHILFNQLYKWCMAHDCIKKNYVENLKINVKSNPSSRKSFSTEEINVLWSNVGKNAYVPIVSDVDLLRGKNIRIA